MLGTKGEHSLNLGFCWVLREPTVMKSLINTLREREGGIKEVFTPNAFKRWHRLRQNIFVRYPHRFPFEMANCEFLYPV